MVTIRGSQCRGGNQCSEALTAVAVLQRYGRVEKGTKYAAAIIFPTLKALEVPLHSLAAICSRPHTHLTSCASSN